MENNIKTTCKLLSIKGNWKEIKDACMTTINKKAVSEPTADFKYKILLSEHSPLRLLTINAKWYNLPYWVSVHFTRHKFGIEHFVSTQRTDRTNIDRNNMPQNALVTHQINLNAQAVINISRKRKCCMASLNTIQAWSLFLDCFREKEPELFNICVPNCIYRGFCPEFFSCGYYKTAKYKNELNKYQSLIE